MPTSKFDNRYRRQLPGEQAGPPGPHQVHGAAWSTVSPTPVAAPRLLAWSEALGAELGLSRPLDDEALWTRVLAGNASVPGMQPYAMCYGGHQFGNWAGQLGDGRAISLGEMIGADGRHHELQLKGAGPTPYSRSADGRAVLRSSLREFLCSEAMHHLGVPTTRALSLVATGEAVIRDMFYDGRPRAEPGAIVCRVAPSFIRLGHFELPASRGDVDLLRQLVRFTITTHFPDFADGTELDIPAWFAEVCRRTARLMVDWQRLGFVHGVMNTDNLSIHGLTIDYGPYGWLEPFDPRWTPNTTDADGRRYCFGNQPGIAQWNLSCLAQALAPLLDDPQTLVPGLGAFAETFHAAYAEAFAAKLGLRALAHDDALLDELYGLMVQVDTDYGLIFRCLGDVPAEGDDAAWLATLEPAFYEGLPEAGELRERWLAWLAHYRQRLQADGWPAAERRARMHAVNPLYVPRNYLAQQAIDAAEAGDIGELDRLMAVLRQPYTEQPGQAAYAARRPDWARDKPGCSALSCSS